MVLPTCRLGLSRLHLCFWEAGVLAPIEGIQLFSTSPKQWGGGDASQTERITLD
jgi:hypothetical protein